MSARPAPLPALPAATCRHGRRGDEDPTAAAGRPSLNHPHCCLTLSRRLVATLRSALPPAPAATLSIGCGTGLLEALVLGGASEQEEAEGSEGDEQERRHDEDEEQEAEDAKGDTVASALPSSARRLLRLYGVEVASGSGEGEGESESHDAEEVDPEFDFEDKVDVRDPASCRSPYSYHHDSAHLFLPSSRSSYSPASQSPQSSLPHRPRPLPRLPTLSLLNNSLPDPRPPNPSLLPENRNQTRAPPTAAADLLLLPLSYLRPSSRLLVRDTRALLPAHIFASLPVEALLFVYPRDPRLVRRYVDRAPSSGFVGNSVIWAGPRRDWEGEGDERTDGGEANTDESLGKDEDDRGRGGARVAAAGGPRGGDAADAELRSSGTGDDGNSTSGAGDSGDEGDDEDNEDESRGENKHDGRPGATAETKQAKQGVAGAEDEGYMRMLRAAGWRPVSTMVGADAGVAEHEVVAVLERL